MAKKYMYEGTIKVAVTGTFEDDGEVALEDQALEALKDAASISENYNDDVEADEFIVHGFFETE